jgi:hypothetical protein
MNNGKASNDYSINATFNPLSQYLFTHKSNSVTLDGFSKFWAKDKTYATLYTKTDLTQDEKTRSVASTALVRVHHEDKAIVSFGLENLDLINCKNPDQVSASALVGTDLKNGYKAFGGLYTKYALGCKCFLTNKFLLGLKHKDVTAHLEFATEKKMSECSKEDSDCKGCPLDKNVTLRFDGTVSKDLKVGGDAKLNLGSNKVVAKLFGNYTVDKNTSVRVKVDNDKNALSLGVTHNYRGLVTFGFISNFTFAEAVAEKKEGEKVIVEAKKAHIKTKFGVVAELNETLI